jgi:hypothetical protein
MLAGLADAQQALSDRLEAAVGQLRAELKPNLQQVRNTSVLSETLMRRRGTHLSLAAML